MRFLPVIAFIFAFLVNLPHPLAAQEGMIGGGMGLRDLESEPMPASEGTPVKVAAVPVQPERMDATHPVMQSEPLPSSDPIRENESAVLADPVVPPSPAWCQPCEDEFSTGYATAKDLDWINDVRVGYDSGFLIASRRQQNLGAGNFPFQLKLNGWGQLRHTITKFTPDNRDLNQFQLKRGRLVFTGSAFNPNFSYFIQLDGRSSSGDDVRMLDYYLSYDIGHALFGLDKHTFGFRTGKYKMPFTMARWLSGRDFEFTDRSVASTFFDVNRSFAWGLYGQTDRLGCPLVWETAIFNGLVTGGAETGSSGQLDDNFAYSGRVYAFPVGRWGAGSLADFEYHDRLAVRCGMAFANSRIDRAGRTEFESVRVVDSGARLSSIIPLLARSYSVSLFSVDTSIKWRGWSSTLEYYFRQVGDFNPPNTPDLFDHGFWFQLGKFVVNDRVQLLLRWSRVVGDSGTLGVTEESADEVGVGLAWYFRENHSKAVLDITHLNGAPINASALDITPGNRGMLLRSQIQFSF